MSGNDDQYLPERRSVEIDVAVLKEKIVQLHDEIKAIKLAVNELVKKDNIKQGSFEIITFVASAIGAGFLLIFQLAWNYLTKGH